MRRQNLLLMVSLYMSGVTALFLRIGIRETHTIGWSSSRRYCCASLSATKWLVSRSSLVMTVVSLLGSES